MQTCAAYKKTGTSQEQTSGFNHEYGGKFSHHFLSWMEGHQTVFHIPIQCGVIYFNWKIPLLFCDGWFPANIACGFSITNDKHFADKVELIPQIHGVLATIKTLIIKSLIRWKIHMEIEYLCGMAIPTHGIYCLRSIMIHFFWARVYTPEIWTLPWPFTWI